MHGLKRRQLQAIKHLTIATIQIMSQAMAGLYGNYLLLMEVALFMRCKMFWIRCLLFKSVTSGKTFEWYLREQFWTSWGIVYKSLQEVFFKHILYCTWSLCTFSLMHNSLSMGLTSWSQKFVRSSCFFFLFIFSCKWGLRSLRYFGQQNANSLEVCFFSHHWQST